MHPFPRVGDKVIATTRSCYGAANRKQQYRGTVEAVTEHFMVISTDKYRITILAVDLKCGQAEVKHC